MTSESTVKNLLVKVCTLPGTGDLPAHYTISITAEDTSEIYMYAFTFSTGELFVQSDSLVMPSKADCMVCLNVLHAIAAKYQISTIQIALSDSNPNDLRIYDWLRTHLTPVRCEGAVTWYQIALPFVSNAT